MGKVHKFGDNIDTDVIVPGKYLSLQTDEELAKICLDGYEPNYAEKISDGDVFVCGRNFGCGSSREHAPIAIKAAGVRCIIGASFARIFYRNAINIGLPVLEAPEAAEAIQAGDDVDIDLEQGIIADKTSGQSFHFAPFPPQILGIVQAGGLEAYYKQNRKG